MLPLAQAAASKRHKNPVNVELEEVLEYYATEPAGTQYTLLFCHGGILEIGSTPRNRGG